MPDTKPQHVFGDPAPVLLDLNDALDDRGHHRGSVMQEHPAEHLPRPAAPAVHRGASNVTRNHPVACPWLGYI